MMYKTLDGYKLQAGDSCFVNCLLDDDNASYQVMEAIYNSDKAIKRGFEFEIPNLNCDVGVVQVWKNDPRSIHFEKMREKPFKLPEGASQRIIK